MADKSGHMHYTIDLGSIGEVELSVVYRYYPATPDVWYLSNGDPGYPGSPAEVEFEMLSVKTEDGKWTELPKWLCDKIYAAESTVDQMTDKAIENETD